MYIIGDLRQLKLGTVLYSEVTNILRCLKMPGGGGFEAKECYEFDSLPYAAWIEIELGQLGWWLWASNLTPSWVTCGCCHSHSFCETLDALDPQTHQPLSHRPKVRLSHPMCDLPNPTTPSEVHQHFCRCPKEVNAPCTFLGRGAKMLSGNQDRVEGGSKFEVLWVDMQLGSVGSALFFFPRSSPKSLNLQLARRLTVLKAGGRQAWEPKILGTLSEAFRKAQSSTAIKFRKPRIFRWSCGAEQETEETMAAAPAIFDNLWSFWRNYELGHVGTENPTPKNLADLLESP